jgi:hypothetical protein
MENEVSRTTDVSQWKLIRDGEQISGENLCYIQYYKKVCMSNDQITHHYLRERTAKPRPLVEVSR